MLEDAPAPVLDEKIFGRPDSPAAADVENVNMPRTIDEEGPKSESPAEKV